MKKFPFYKQPDSKDCGSTCLRIIARYYNKSVSLQKVRDLSETTREGSSLQGLSNAAETLGFKSLGVKIDFKTFHEEVPLPCIVHWNKKHFVVVYHIDNKRKVYISDPSYGLITYNEQEFIKCWIGENADDSTEEGITLLLETTPAFFENEYEERENKASFSFLSKYLQKYNYKTSSNRIKYKKNSK